MEKKPLETDEEYYKILADYKRQINDLKIESSHNFNIAASRKVEIDRLRKELLELQNKYADALGHARIIDISNVTVEGKKL